ncbi:MFS transporter [Prauserella cavernicola]|uniref:MFS transporter n=1 Tax=Prauserella cavernicola TaxID=2800127 RepID=A0A934QTB7_9PSEU|nr:MFS transporter [Prauserella cavernicola]MBK1786140.1 MFS transporter [Prauserella cavernicola]
MQSRYALQRYLLGATTARTGDEMSGPALLVLGFSATGSIETASALLTGLTISAAVGGPLLGVVLDRSHRPGVLLAVALGGYAAGLGVVLAGTGTVATPLVVAVAVVAGLLSPALSGGWTAQLPRLVGPGILPRATGLDAMTFGAASLAGPALAGLLAGAYGATVPMLLAIGLVAGAIPVAWSLPRQYPASHDPARHCAPHRDLLAGIRAIGAARSLLRATATSVVSFAGFGMLLVACPLLGEQRLGDAGLGALLLAAMAAAGLLANTALARWPALLNPPDRIVLASTVLLGAGTVTAALTGSPALTVAALALTGLGEGPQLTALFAIRHREAPEHLRAQIFTTGASLKITAMALGSALAGPLAAYSPTACLLAAAGFEALAALTYLAVRVRTPSPARAA